MTVDSALAANAPQLLAGLLVTINLLLCLLLWRQGRRLRGQAREGAALRRDIEAMQRELGALCSGAAGAGSHLSRLDQQILRLVERQDRLELRESVPREYDRAVRLIREGAGVEQVMGQCDVVRAEAELLVRMHGAARARDRQPQTVGGKGMRVSGLPM